MTRRAVALVVPAARWHRTIDLALHRFRPDPGIELTQGVGSHFTGQGSPGRVPQEGR